MTNEHTPPLTLIVDGDPATRTRVRAILEAEDWPVLEASDGREALRLLTAGPKIGFMVTGIKLQGMTGIELAAALRAFIGRMPVLYLTGCFELLFAGRTTLPQDDAFLTKPFSRLELLQAVYQSVALYRAPLRRPAVQPIVFRVCEAM
jgi:CheY-like chemotaxis protein